MTPDTLGRLCGWLYVLATVCFIAGTFTRSRTFDGETSSVVLENLRSAPLLARVNTLVELLTVLAFLATALAFYVLFADVNQLMAALIVVFVVIGVPIELAALADQRAAVATASSGTGADASVATLLAGEASLRIMHELIAGLWLLPLAYLAATSGYVPKAVALVLFVAGVGWLVHLGLAILAPQLERIASYVVLSAVGELVFMMWLVLRGVEVPAS